jgi:hypothetical protein
LTRGTQIDDRIDYEKLPAEPAICAAAAAALLFLPPAFAQDGGDGPTTIPNGPYGDNDSLASLRSYDQLFHALEQSVHSSNGTATLNYANWKSNSGRQVPYVVIGNGPTAVMFIAQQHGDEMETSDLSRSPGGTEPGISRNAYGLLGAGSVLLELRGGLGTRSGGYIQRIGYHAALAIAEALARDATLSAYDPNLADVLVAPANGQPPSQGNQGEAIVDGYVADPVDDVDDHHLGKCSVVARARGAARGPLLSFLPRARCGARLRERLRDVRLVDDAIDAAERRELAAACARPLAAFKTKRDPG